MKVPLTERQKIIYEFIKKEIRRNGNVPSVSEICDEIGLKSTSTVHAHLEILHRKGWIKRFPSKNRKIEIMEKGFYDAQRKVVQVQIVTEIVNGVPKLGEANEKFLLPLGELNAKSCYMYKIQENYSEAKILSGDLLLVQVQKKYENDDLIIVQKDNEVVAAKFGADIKGKVCGKVLRLFRWF